MGVTLPTMRVRRRLPLTLALLVLAGTAGAVQAANVAVLPPGGGPHVRILDATGGDRGGFLAYGDYFQGGVKVAGADVDGTGAEEVITGAGPGGGPHVRVFDHGGSERTGWLAYPSGFAGGVRVAGGDLDGDGRDEVITAPGFGGGPHVRVFDGTNGNEYRGFLAYDSRFTGGVSVASGDVNGDGRDEIITAAGYGGGPHVRIFDTFGTEMGGFLAYDPGFAFGVTVAAGDVDGDGRDEIITAPGQGGGPHVRAFRASGTEVVGFMAYDPGFTGGVSVAAGDVASDDRAEIITGPGNGGGSHVRVYSLGTLRSEFFAYPNYYGGVNVATARPSSIGAERVITGAGVERYEVELRPGDRGADVARLQRRLTDLGFWLGPQDSVYGYTTEQAVYAFQKYAGLPRHGRADVRTQSVLGTAGRPVPLSASGDLIEIDKSSQLLYVVRDGRTLWVLNTSTGSGRPYTYAGRTYVAQTPEGRFRVEREINGMRVSHLGQLYRPKYFQGGYAVHGSPSVPPYPASHGCVRLSNPAMDFVWAARLMPIGMPVWVHG